jgi:hypothetical protein
VEPALPRGYSPGPDEPEVFTMQDAWLKRELKSPRWITAKGLLFLALGLLASAGLLLEHPTPRVALLLAVAVWGFARFYYFAFYVLQRYVDPHYRFSGLGSLAIYLLRRRGPAPAARPGLPP